MSLQLINELLQELRRSVSLPDISGKAKEIGEPSESESSTSGPTHEGVPVPPKVHMVQAKETSHSPEDEGNPEFLLARRLWRKMCPLLGVGAHLYGRGRITGSSTTTTPDEHAIRCCDHASRLCWDLCVVEQCSETLFLPRHADHTFKI